MQTSISSIIDWLAGDGLTIGIIVVLSIFSLYIIRIGCHRLFSLHRQGPNEWDRRKRARTLNMLVRSLLGAATLIVAVILVLKVLNIQLAPFFAAAGIAGLAIGLGAQQLIRDVIDGFFMMFDDEVREGDIIEVAGIRGTVERLSLRRTVIRDLGGNVHHIPNSKIDVVTNMTKEYSRYMTDLPVSYRENVDEVFTIIREVGEDMQRDPVLGDWILEPVEIMGLDRFAESAMLIKVRFKTRPIKQWKVGREFNRRIKIAFDERNIEIPLPHLTVYAGERKSSPTPPFPMTVDSENVAASR